MITVSPPTTSRAMPMLRASRSIQCETRIRRSTPVRRSHRRRTLKIRHSAGSVLGPAKARFRPLFLGFPPRQCFEQAEIDGIADGEIARAVRMQLIAGAAGRAFGHELALQRAARRIERDLVEVDERVEQAGCPDEIIERLAFDILLGEAMRGARAPQRGDNGGADDAQS